ncbi:cell division protein FtsA [Bauldia litoralis]|uniref:Cell division protein FtsA n=2 Tax=Bauldia litoralis TaxID=665467 RepID=A0A1G6D3I7_9HYPH|nr:cell division protein FtsA [Bauldia litoralis]SDB39733.1 cell division protein FtsA [Bauldia litoralis]
MKMFGQPDQKRAIVRRPTIVSILDIGSSKICCLIARLKPLEEGESAEALRGRTHSIEVIGIGHQRSRGIKSGVVVNLDAAEQAIRLAVDAAERQAGITVDSLIVNISAGRLGSETYSASVALSGKAVEEVDIGRVLAAGRRHSVSDGRSVVHAMPIGYSLDANGGIADPRGMVGERLGVDMHMVTGDAQPLRNIELCINRCHLSVERLVATPYASGLSVLVDDESELGCASVDFGGGTTTIAVFSKGEFVHVDAIAIGGQHITTDIARGLSTRLDVAERLKTVYGSALPSPADEREIISVPTIGDDENEPANQIPRSALTRIIRPRVEEILELVRDRLNESGYAALVGRRMVLTGGASQLTGLVESARRVLARNVRLGRPLGIAGLPEVAKGPAFSTAVGLIIYPQVATMEQCEGGSDRPFAMTGTGGYLARVGHWFRESF